MGEKLKDTFGRTFPYIRLSITDVCNFKCGYCLPNGYFKPNNHPGFLNINEIDLVCHAFADETDMDKQLEFFKVPIRMNKFRKVKYNQGISTTDIINKIKREY